MASTLQFTPNTYNGEAAAGYVSKALLGATSLAEGHLQVIPNIKKRRVLRTLEQEVIFQDASCQFNPEGNTVIGERALTPVEMSVMYELCYHDLRDSWEARQLNAGTGNEEVPSDLAQFLIGQMRSKINAGIEKLIWLGKTGSEFAFSGSYPGLLALMEADNTVRKMALPASASQSITGITVAANAVVSVSSTANLRTGDRVSIQGVSNALLANGAPISGQSFTITVINGTSFSLNATTTGTAQGAGGTAQFVNRSNVIEVLTTLYNSLPDTLKHHPDFKLFVPMHVADAYRLVQAEVATGAGAWFATERALNFLGKPLVALPWFRANHLAATLSTNLFFGTDLLADFNAIQVVDLRNSTADQKVRFRAAFSSDVNYAFGEQIVLCRAA